MKPFGKFSKFPSFKLFIEFLEDLVGAQNSFFNTSGKFVGYGHGSMLDIIREVVVQVKVRLDALPNNASVIVDCAKSAQVKTFLNTTESAVTMGFINFGEVTNIVVYNGSGGESTITLSGTNLKFVDMDAQASPATTLDVACTDAVYTEISISDSGNLDGVDRILLVIKK